MTTVVLVLHLMLAIALVGVILIQRSEGGGLGIGGGGGFMTTRGTANLLTRTTGILAVGFFVTSLFLSWLAGYERKPTSIIDGTSAPVSQPGGALVPPTSGGLLDSLKKSDEQQPPSGPQAPRSQ